ncbi:uncharacterized protein MEPE_05079 [Melanopsichium pennsylvanicum]|uniref:Uncharacterized protein n=1 Tax=Melanopsichium pennsylvanicum TaxID=63383 RepID=A0AAJ5C6Z1_9BASI|nr:uncharacterized protein MEPE_05079 [Melanopsichium pennsylvanicum]
MARTYEVPCSTACSIQQRFQEHGSVQSGQKGGAMQCLQLQNQHIEYLMRVFEQQPRATLQELQQELNDQSKNAHNELVYNCTTIRIYTSIPCQGPVIVKAVGSRYRWAATAGIGSMGTERLSGGNLMSGRGRVVRSKSYWPPPVPPAVTTSHRGATMLDCQRPYSAYGGASRGWTVGGLC